MLATIGQRFQVELMPVQQAKPDPRHSAYGPGEE